jgi:hypothetical protein
MSRLFADARDVLLLRITAERIGAFSWQHLLLGLALTALVGAGRWYDDVRAIPLQQAGVGSVVYVFILSALLWSVSKPLAKNIRFNWTYLKVLTYVTLTAPPAILYAFPIEIYGDDRLHLIYNTSALFIVSVWRVAMIVRFFIVGAEMTKVEAGVTTATVASGIITVLGFFGVIKAVAQSMGGYRNEGEAFAAGLAGFGFLGGVVVGIVSLIWYSSLVMNRRGGFYNPFTLSPQISNKIVWPVAVSDSADPTFNRVCEDVGDLTEDLEHWLGSNVPGETVVLTDASGQTLNGRISHRRVDSLYPVDSAYGRVDAQS